MYFKLLMLAIGFVSFVNLLGVRSRVSKKRKLESAYSTDPAKIIEVKDGRPSLYLLSFLNSGIPRKPNGKKRYYTSIWLAPYVGEQIEERMESENIDENSDENSDESSDENSDESSDENNDESSNECDKEIEENNQNKPSINSLIEKEAEEHSSKAEASLVPNDSKPQEIRKRSLYWHFLQLSDGAECGKRIPKKRKME